MRYCSNALVTMFTEMRRLLSTPAAILIPFMIIEIFTNSEPNACGGFLINCYSRRKSICIHLTYHLLLCMCGTVSVGPLLIPRTLKHKSQVIV